MRPEEVHNLLRTRMSVYPPQYVDKPIQKAVLQEILETANWAPTHKLTEPWRFKVFTGKSKKKLGDFMAEKYRKSIPMSDFSIREYEKAKMNPVRSGCVMAICVQRDPEARVPEWEETAAVAMAVQNIWISATAHKIGGYWSSPKFIESMHELVSMNAGEKCIGLFYMGYYKPTPVNRKRTPIEQKLSWYE